MELGDEGDLRHRSMARMNAVKRTVMTSNTAQVKLRLSSRSSRYFIAMPSSPRDLNLLTYRLGYCNMAQQCSLRPPSVAGGIGVGAGTTGGGGDEAPPLSGGVED